jgi:hypothetical protein
MLCRNGEVPWENIHKYKLNKKIILKLALMLGFNKAPSPTRWCYQSQVNVVAFLKNYFFLQTKEGTTF